MTEELKDQEAQGVTNEEVLRDLEKIKEEEQKSNVRHIDPAKRAFILRPGFVWNPWRRYPRNLACFCGSGVKFKNCHDGKISPAISYEDFKKVEHSFKMFVNGVTELKNRGIAFKREAPTPDQAMTIQPKEEPCSDTSKT